jgi:tetratricopeptide (TPR) repeat protein
MLTTRDREAGHRLAAAWIERTVAGATDAAQALRLEEHAGELAYHLRHSGDREGAVRFLRLAARRALRTAALGDAMRYLEDALAIAESDTPTPASLRLAYDLNLEIYAPVFIAHTAASLRIREVCERAEMLAKRLGDADLLATARGRRAGHHFARAEYDDAVRCLSDELERGRELADAARIGSVAVVFCGSLMQIGAFARLAREARLFEELLRENKLTTSWLGQAYPPYLACCGSLALACGVSGSVGDAKRFGAKAIEVGEEVGHPYARAVAYCWDSWARFAMGDGPGARASASRSVEIGDASALPTIRAIGRYTLAGALVLDGRASEAVAIVTEAMELADRLGYVSFRTDALYALASARIQMGDVTAASDVCNQALAIVRAGEGKFLARFERCLGEIAARSNDLAGAARHFDESVRLAKEQGALVFGWETELAAASCSGARERLEELRVTFAARGLDGLEARARAALSQL